MIEHDQWFRIHFAWNPRHKGHKLHLQESLASGFNALQFRIACKILSEPLNHAVSNCVVLVERVFNFILKTLSILWLSFIKRKKREIVKPFLPISIRQWAFIFVINFIWPWCEKSLRLKAMRQSFYPKFPNKYGTTLIILEIFSDSTFLFGYNY